MFYRRIFPLVLITLCLAGEATAQIGAAPITPLPSQPADNVISEVPGCPDQGGILDSVSVPVGDPLELAVVLTGGNAPPGGARFRLSSDDATVVAAGDPRQGFLPEVTIPEGGTVSNPFNVFGIRVGSTVLRATALTEGFNGFAVPLGAWDIGLEGGTKFLDANRPGRHCRESDDSADLSTDETVLATCGSAAEGIVTDGVSRLLMRTRSGLSGTACYEVVSTAASDQGSIDPAIKPTVAVDDIAQASSYYRAPPSFEEMGASRSVEVEFTFTPSIGNGNTTHVRAETTLVRPPVVLVHGIWSDGGAWRDFFIRNDMAHTTFAGDYEATNDASFSENVPEVREFIDDAIEQSRTKGYATTQVDVIGHSMGGLLTRLYAQDPEYHRPENLGEGDIRRLLTLDTPHFGSNFANLIVALHDAEPGQTEATVTDIIPGNAQVTNGAVCDLAENSPALQQLAGGTALSAHVITATGGPPGTDAEPAEYWGGVLGIFSDFEAALTETECVRRNRFFVCEEERHIFPQEIVDGHRFRQENDAIVPVSSQRGGFDATSQVVDNFADLLHFGATLVDGVTNQQQVANLALPLLDQPADADAWAASFPGVQSDGTGTPLTVPGLPDDGDGNIYDEQCDTGSPMKPAATQNAPNDLVVAQSTGDSRVWVVSPVMGDVFSPGDTVVVTVELETPLVANDIKVRLPGLGRLPGTDYDGFTYQASFSIPEAFAGPITIIPSITDEAGDHIEGTPVTIAVRSDVSPTQIYFVQPNHQLDLSRSEQAQLRVIGVYPDDIEREITTAATGTTYLSRDTGVVSVGADGKLTPVGPGTAVVTVENMGAVDAAMIRVVQGNQALPPAVVTDELDIRRSGLRLDRRTGFFVQQVRIANNDNTPVLGPIYMVVSGLPEEVELINKDGITQSLGPIGSPYLRLSQLTDGLNLGSGESVDLRLQFLNPNRRRIDYALEAFRTTTDP